MNVLLVKFIHAIHEWTWDVFRDLFWVWPWFYFGENKEVNVSQNVKHWKFKACSLTFKSKMPIILCSDVLVMHPLWILSLLKSNIIKRIWLYCNISAWWYYCHSFFMVSLFLFFCFLSHISLSVSLSLWICRPCSSLWVSFGIGWNHISCNSQRGNTSRKA